MDPLKPDSKQPAPEAAGQGATVEVLTYSVKEAATALGVSQTSVYRLLYRRLLKPVTGIRRKRIAKKQVHQLAQGGTR